LAEIYKLDAEDLPKERSLNHAVCLLLRLRKIREDICDDIFQIMKTAQLRPSKPLRQLAQITDFNLYVTTTFDPLLELAINEMRFDGASGTAAINYSPKRVDDLPATKEELTKPTVYYLLGKLSPTGAYVISDEDLLEYICDLQSANRRPQRLFHELKENHLLLLGADFSDWLARLFLRTAKGGRLSTARDFFEILADSDTRRDPRLVSFLVHFSSRTRVFHAGGAIEFVDELWTRWRERNPGSAASSGSPARREIPRDAIFLSYSRDDLAAVNTLRAGLEQAGLPVWFDHESLKPGDNFNPLIEQCITRVCQCFIPVISANTERKEEGYFRREWTMAVERARGIHFERQFIVPVVIDEETEPNKVPLTFRDINYTRLPGGRVTPEFLEKLRRIVAGA
jgi:hypothetical protein